MTRLALMAMLALAACSSSSPTSEHATTTAGEQTTTTVAQTDFEWCLDAAEASGLSPESCAAFRGRDQFTAEGCRRVLAEIEDIDPSRFDCDQFPTQAQIDEESE